LARFSVTAPTGWRLVWRRFGSEAGDTGGAPVVPGTASRVAVPFKDVGDDRCHGSAASARREQLMVQHDTAPHRKVVLKAHQSLLRSGP
jgi:hypothetical protein